MVGGALRRDRPAAGLGPAAGALDAGRVDAANVAFLAGPLDADGRAMLGAGYVGGLDPGGGIVAPACDPAAHALRAGAVVRRVCVRLSQRGLGRTARAARVKLQMFVNSGTSPSSTCSVCANPNSTPTSMMRPRVCGVLRASGGLRLPALPGSAAVAGECTTSVTRANSLSEHAPQPDIVSKFGFCTRLALSPSSRGRIAAPHRSSILQLCDRSRARSSIADPARAVFV